MPTRPAPLADTLAVVLNAILVRQGWTQTFLAHRIGVTQRTVRRYLLHGDLPPPARRHGIIHALPDVDPLLLERLARSLDIAQDFARGLPQPTTQVDVAQARAALDAAVVEAADRVDAGPARTRLALHTFLERLASAGIDRDVARSLLGSASPEAKKG